MKCVHMIFFILLMLTGCASLSIPGVSENEMPPVTPSAEPEKKAEYRSISAEKAKEMMVEECILLDVRTDEEYQQGRIEGAILIPDYEIAARAEKELPDKDALVLIYCRSGRRSALAANELVNQGYTNVYDFGGIADWPYDTVSD